MALRTQSIWRERSWVRGDASAILFCALLFDYGGGVVGGASADELCLLDLGVVKS